MYKNVKDRIVRINDRDRGEREWCTENKADQFEKFEVLWKYTFQIFLQKHSPTFGYKTNFS